MDGFRNEQHTTDWSFDGVYTRYHHNSYINGDRCSSTNSSEFPPINRPRLVKIVSFWLTLLLVGLICAIIYLAHIRETKTRYYISHGKLAILQEYTTALGNKDSMEYKSLTASFCNEMNKSFRSSRSHTNTYRMCIVTNLRPGSVIVTFTLYFDATVDLSDTEVITTINNSVQHIGSKNMLGNYPIDINGLSVTTTLTLYEQDPIPFLEPDSDFIIPPTTKQTTTAATSTSTSPETVTTAISPADTTETKKTTTSTTETTKVKTMMTQPTTKTTKSTTTMPMTTTAETTTYSHTEAITTLLTSTTEPKTTTTLPSTVTTKLTTTIPLTTTTEGTTSSQTSPTTTITQSSLAPTVTSKPTTTIGLPITTQDTKTTTFVPSITTEATTSTNLPPSSTTKATTLTSFTSSTEAKTTTIMSLITTVASTSLSPTTETKTTTTEAKRTTTLSPSTTTDQTTMTMTPTVTSEVTTTATGSPVVTTEETTVTNTTKEATTSKNTTEATATNTTIEDTTREVMTEATTASTTAAAATNITREDITTALFANTTKDVTTENTITMTTGEFTNDVTINTTEPAVTNTTREYTTETAVTNTIIEDTTVVNSSWDTTGTSSIATTVSPFTADVMFPSKNILAREDTTLECVITVTDQWEKVTINQETEKDFVFLAEFYNNGSVFSQVTSEFLSVVFKQDNETIETIIHINIQNLSSCPSLLHFGCGIIMEDTFKSVITKTSILSITAPLHNVTLDMANVYYSGERLELICRTITDFEYGHVSLEVRSPNGSVFREPAPRTKYASTKNSDCSVNFEWKFKSRISLDSSLNGSTVWCIASNRLLNTSVSTSQLITVLVSEVSFSQYYVSGSVGKPVTIECKTNTLSSDIDKMAVYKTFNGTNETTAVYSNGNTNSSSDLIVTFLDGVLTLTLSSLKCSDEGLYICVVTTGNSEVSTPLFLTLQPTVLAGSTGVYMSLNIDIVENTYRYTSEHSCFGEIGYPDANGYLSLTATHPTSGETVVYNEEVVTDAMKVKSTVGLGVYDYGVTLADDFGILIREDRKVQENCSIIHKVRFFLNVSREWSRGSLKCEIRTKEERIPTSVKEEQFYVIPGDACDNNNKTTPFNLDHERQDNCYTYIRCGSQEPPEGKMCLEPTLCMDLQIGYCYDCERATCREIRTTTDTPTTESMQGNGYLDCNSSYVFEGETANIGCNLNTTSFFSINVTRLNSTIASILADGSVIVYSEYQGKLTAVLSLASLRLSITLSSVICSDSDTYTSKMYLHSGHVPFTTFNVIMKVKPENPSLTLNHSLIDGQNLKSHSCTGYVGNPPGFLEIQIKRFSYSNFTKYSTPLQRISSSLVDAGNCSFRQTLDFSIDLTSDSWSNVTMRCVAVNPVSLDVNDVVPSSFLFSVTSITSDFCKNKTGDYYDYHPMGCPFFVRCYRGTPYSKECPNNLCINPELKACVNKDWVH